MTGLPKLTEREFQDQVVQYAHLHGWIVATFRPARVLRDGKEIYETPVGADGKGWPDLFMVKGNRAEAFELKVGKRTATLEQMDWLNKLDSVPGVGAWLMYPSDWPLIEQLLGG